MVTSKRITSWAAGEDFYVPPSPPPANAPVAQYCSRQSVEHGVYMLLPSHKITVWAVLAMTPPDSRLKLRMYGTDFGMNIIMG
jgi:hypothetical protein